MDVVTVFDEAMGRAAVERTDAFAAAVKVIAADLAVLKKCSKLMGWSQEVYQSTLKEISDGFDARCAEIERKHTEEVMAALAIIAPLLDRPTIGQPAGV